jgi:hypothetical protein
VSSSFAGVIEELPLPAGKSGGGKAVIMGISGILIK